VSDGIVPEGPTPPPVTPTVPTISPPASDEVLASRAAAGSVAAFETLARRYQAVLLRFLQRRSPREAEDVLQEAFLRAYRSIGSYRPGRPFKPWLFTIAYRLAVDAGRRSGPRLADLADAPADAGPGPLEQLASQESAERLWAIVRASLGKEPFTAVWLHYADDLSPRQVAAVMGRSQVWVRTTLHRARKRLATVLESARWDADSAGSSAGWAGYDQREREQRHANV
jgi:RNA polymerase sigma-70 factor (ECF subfamily)